MEQCSESLVAKFAKEKLNFAPVILTNRYLINYLLWAAGNLRCRYTTEKNIENEKVNWDYNYFYFDKL